MDDKNEIKDETVPAVEDAVVTEGSQENPKTEAKIPKTNYDKIKAKQSKEPYKIKLPIFEGPLDLLLYLIKKEELDIYDIPIAKITDQYLEYLELMQLMDLGIAGEFLVMAATLMHIKSKMLLPQEENAIEEGVIEQDPRAELVKRLLEYRKFKDAASSLAELEKMQKDLFPRVISPEFEELVTKDAIDAFEANIFDLITAFVKVVKNLSKEDFHKVVQDEFTVSQKIHDIYHLLVAKPYILFTDLFGKAKNRLEAITIFLALLELIRLNEIKIIQKEHFGEIEIMRNQDAIKPKPEVEVGAETDSADVKNESAENNTKEGEQV